MTTRGAAAPCPLFEVAVSDNDRLIAVAHDNGLVGLYQPVLAAELGLGGPWLYLAGHTRSVRAVAFEPPGAWDSTRLASGSVDGTIRAWDVGDESRNFALSHHESSVLCLAFDPAGTRLVSGSEDRSIAITSWPDGTLVRRFAAHEGSVLSVSVSPNRKHIASGGFDGYVYLWSSAGERLACLSDGARLPVWGVRFVDDSRVVFSSGSDLFEWTSRSGCRVLHTGASRYRVHGLAICGDRAEIAFGLANDVLRLNLHNGKVQRHSAHTGEVNSVAYLADGRVASTGDDGALMVWARAGRPDLKLRSGSPQDIPSST